MSQSRPGTLAIVLVSTVFLAWGARFIAATSFVAWDGHRYFCLFDDAMISMRYADSLAHGRGLVWNAGERVEGYTNLLMTLLMAVPSALLEKRFAVLSVQVFGLFVALGVAGASLRLAEELVEPPADVERAILRVTAFALGVAYYPLVFWTLMGMETGLGTLLLLVCLVAFLRFQRRLDLPPLVALALAGGLAFLTRPDTAVVTAPLMVLALLRGRRERRWPLRALLLLAGVYAVLPLAQIGFRATYYGTLAPVTYTLKLGRFPLGFRLGNGWSFVTPFLGQTWLLFAAAGLGVAAGGCRRRLLAFGIPCTFVAYQIWIGGAPSNYWRFLSPGVPILMVLALLGTRWVSRQTVGRISSSPLAVVVGGLVLQAAVVVTANRTFLPEVVGNVAPRYAEDNEQTVSTALALRALTYPSATVGVFMAGAVPYYSERPAIDFLGKSDPRVASLAPDLSGAVAWHGMTSVPGHNKYDLRYSIVSRHPTYVEGCRWGRQDVCRWVDAHYVEVAFEGQRMLLRRRSPLVDWRRAGT